MKFKDLLFLEQHEWGNHDDQGPDQPQDPDGNDDINNPPLPADPGDDEDEGQRQDAEPEGLGAQVLDELAAGDEVGVPHASTSMPTWRTKISCSEISRTS